MTLRLWSFRCDACGHVYDSEPIMSASIPKTIRCRREGCTGRASWCRPSTRVNGIHNSISTLYGRGPDPQYGRIVRGADGKARRQEVTVESYEHKRRLQREMGIEDVGVERADDILGEADPDPGPRPDIGYVDADSDEEAIEKILEKVYTDPRIDRRHTGQARMRMIDSGIDITPRGRQ